METRIERNKKKKKEKIKNVFKIQMFVICLIIFLFGLIVTENSIQELTCIENQKLFSIVLDEKILYIQLFGNDYVIDFISFIKNLIKMIK